MSAMWRPTTQSLGALARAHPLDAFDGPVRFADAMRVDPASRRAVAVCDDDAAAAATALWSHCYTVHGRAMPYSVSRLLADLFGEFERDAHAWRIARAPRTLVDAAYKYWQVGRAPMTLLWDEHVRLERPEWREAAVLFALLAAEADDGGGDVRAFREHYARVAYRELCAAWAQTSVTGTDEHLSAEAFYNGVYCVELPRFQTPAFRQFLLWHAEWVRARGLVPFRTELRVCDFGSAARGADGRILEALCGSVDLVLAAERDVARWQRGAPLDVVVVDYKFNDSISDYAEGFARAPLDRVRASKREKQATQLAAYTAMIEAHTPLRVRSAHVAQFTRDAYHVYDMPRERVALMPAAFRQFIERRQCAD